MGEEEEEDRRSRGGAGGDGTSLSSQFMAYIERRITREVGAEFEFNSMLVETVRNVQQQHTDLKYHYRNRKFQNLHLHPGSDLGPETTNSSVSKEKLMVFK